MSNKNTDRIEPEHGADVLLGARSPYASRCGFKDRFTQSEESWSDGRYVTYISFVD
jgi:hypothetical protein